MLHLAQRRRAPDLQPPTMADAEQTALQKQLRSAGGYDQQAELLRPKGDHAAPVQAYTYGNQRGGAAAQRNTRAARPFTLRMSGGSTVLEPFHVEAQKRFPNMRLFDGTDRMAAALANEERMQSQGRVDPRSAIDIEQARANMVRPVDVTVHLRVVKQGAEEVHVATVSGPEGTMNITLKQSEIATGYYDALNRICDAIDKVH